jgi:demethylmenaquinone methyltransferase / 2-methoxy-6-polyprenyl-1,4-benzoquinol methylase
LRTSTFNIHGFTNNDEILSSNGHLIARKFFSSENASSYDKTVKLATFYKDSSWKKEMVASLGGKNKLILDLACGTGILSSFIRQKSVQSRIVGTDLTFEYLKHAKSRQKYLLLTNSLAEFLPYKNDSFDVILSSYLAKYCNISAMVKEHWRVLRKGGTVIFHDFTYPHFKIMKILWHAYFRILNQFGKVIPSWRDVFSNLDKVIQRNQWVNSLLKELDLTGFSLISKKYCTCGTAAIVWAIKE